jgi:hypothetical protein
MAKRPGHLMVTGPLCLTFRFGRTTLALGPTSASGSSEVHTD